MFLLLTLNIFFPFSNVSIVDFEHVNVSLEWGAFFADLNMFFMPEIFSKLNKLLNNLKANVAMI